MYKRIDDSWEVKLCVIDQVTPNNDSITIYQSALKILHERFTGSSEELADMVVNVRNQLKQNNIYEKILVLMQGIGQTVPANLAKQSFAEYASAYAVLRIKGWGHEQSIAGVRGVMTNLWEMAGVDTTMNSTTNSQSVDLSAMEEMKESLCNDVKNLKRLEFVRNLHTEVGNEFKLMVEGSNGEDIINVGRAMMEGVLDLFLQDIEKGFNALNILFKGFPELPYSELLPAFYEIDRTRSLWVDAGKLTSEVSHVMLAELAFNTYLRWYVITFELYRKMLVFVCYCITMRSKNLTLNIIEFFFRKDPTPNLESWGKERGKILVKYYKPELRHAISHGNVLLVPGKSFTIYETVDKTKDTSAFIRRTQHPINEDLSDMFSAEIEVMYGGLRCFYYLFSYILNRNLTLAKHYLGEEFVDPVFVDVIKDINSR